MGESNLIPKRIFYVWGATERKKRDVLACMQTWRQILPEYEIIEINEESIQYFNFQQELERNRWFKEVYERKLWAYVADYVRIKVLFDNGGIYLDTDVSVLKSFDNFLTCPAFVGMQNEEYVEPAILASKKGNPILGEILQFYKRGIWEEPIYTMPQIFKRIFQARYGGMHFGPKKSQIILKKADFVIFPEKYFIPYRYQDEYTPTCVEDETVTIHWFQGSWLKQEAFDFLDNKHRLDSTVSKKNIISGTSWYFLKILKILEKREVEGSFEYCVLGLPLLSINRNWVKIFGLKIVAIKRY